MTFTDMILDRNKIQDFQTTQANNQYKLGDRLSSAVGGLVDTQNKNLADERSAKAQELQAQITSEWDNPNGILKGLANDSEKARKASSLLAPWDKDLSQKWLAMANEYKAKEEAGNLSREKLKSEEDYNLKKLDQEGATKEREIALKQSELDAKGNAPIKIEAQDYKNAMSAFANGTYPQYYMQATANGTNTLANVLPSPNLDNETIDASLTAGVSGDLVKARTISAQTKGTIAGEAKKSVDLTSANLGLDEAKLGSVQARKDLGYEQSKGRGELSRLARAEVDKIKAVYQKKKDAIDGRNSQVQMLKKLMSTGSPEAFDAIASIVTFNKIIDPTSVVREAEFDIASGATGVVDGVQKKWTKFFDGESLTPDGVKALNDFVSKMESYLTSSDMALNNWVIEQAQSAGGGIVPEDIMGGIAERKVQPTIAQPAQAETQQAPVQSTQKKSGIVSVGAGISAFGGN